VAVVVLGLMFAGSFWEGEDAPVLDAAYCTAGFEDKRAGCARDSGG
jgi:hypothetical protein